MTDPAGEKAAVPSKAAEEIRTVCGDVCSLLDKAREFWEYNPPYNIKPYLRIEEQLKRIALMRTMMQQIVHSLPSIVERLRESNSHRLLRPTLFGGKAYLTAIEAAWVLIEDIVTPAEGSDDQCGHAPRLDSYRLKKHFGFSVRTFGELAAAVMMESNVATQPNTVRPPQVKLSEQEIRVIEALRNIGKPAKQSRLLDAAGFDPHGGSGKGLLALMVEHGTLKRARVGGYAMPDWPD